MRYTVVGYYSDNSQPWIQWVDAQTPRKAALAAIREIIADNKRGGIHMEVSTIIAVECFEGHQYGRLENDETGNKDHFMDRDSASNRKSVNQNKKKG